MNVEEQDEIGAVIERLNLQDDNSSQPDSEADANEVEGREEGEEQEAPEGAEQGGEEQSEPQEAPASKRFAALARREARIVRERQSVQAERTRLKAEREQLQQLANLPALAKQDPLGALERLGLSPEALTEALLEGPPTSSPVTKAELEEMERRLHTEREQAEIERQVRAIRKQVDEHITGDPEAYELINLQGKSSLVFEVIEEAYKQHHRILDVAEASQMVEAHLEEEASKLLSAKKIGAKRQSAQAKAPAKRRSIAGMAATSAGTLAPADSGDPDDADFQRAINAFHKARQR